MCEQMTIHVCMKLWRPEVIIRYLPQSLSALSTQVELSLSLELANSGSSS